MTDYDYKETVSEGKNLMSLEDKFEKIKNILNAVFGDCVKIAKAFEEKVPQLKEVGLSERDLAKYIRDEFVQGKLPLLAFGFIYEEIRWSYQNIAEAFLNAHKIAGWQVCSRINRHSIEKIIGKLETELRYAKKYGDENSTKVKEIIDALNWLNKAAIPIMKATEKKPTTGYKIRDVLENDKEKINELPLAEPPEKTPPSKKKTKVLAS